MILQMVRNECIIFGGCVNIQVSYKTSQFEILKKNLNFAQSTLLSRGTILR
jgi:hypothetical protein